MKVKSKGAFYQGTDGIWGIDTRILVDGEYRHFKKKGYATLSAAKDRLNGINQKGEMNLFDM